MIWTGIGIFCFIILVAVGLMQSACFRAFRHVAQRPKLTGSEFVGKFFPVEQRDVAGKVLELLEPYLPISTARIHPSDRLIDNLGLSARLSCGLDVVAFVQDLENEFKVEFTEEDYLKMQTFRDAVEIISKKTQKRDSSPRRFGAQNDILS